jgi:cell division septation protein DedD
MTAVQDDSTAAQEPAAEPRTCPRCGAPLTADQEWCLECGADVGAIVAPPPSWRGPVLLVAALLTVAAIALVLALVELARDPEQVVEQPAATATPPPVTAQTPTPTPSPAAPTATATSPAATTEIGEWPAGTEGWTVVLESSGTEGAARTRAEELAGQGISVGILDSDDFGSLEPGRWVVFSGQYDSRRAAADALDGLESQVEGAYVRRVAAEAASEPTQEPTTEPTQAPTSEPRPR